MDKKEWLESLTLISNHAKAGPLIIGTTCIPIQKLFLNHGNITNKNVCLLG